MLDTNHILNHISEIKMSDIIVLKNVGIKQEHIHMVRQCFYFFLLV